MLVRNYTQSQVHHPSHQCSHLAHASVSLVQGACLFHESDDRKSFCTCSWSLRCCTGLASDMD